ncbi:hypothetical protein KAR91_55700 [Candidatus Pacearchaeota archaeon]|nr:hypothetical protein [Candidatus Pacearchaeota archaeon]
MNVVELEQKKALLVKFSKREPIGSALDHIQNNTSEAVQILKQGGLKQNSTAEVSPLMRSAKSAVPDTATKEPAFPVPKAAAKTKNKAQKSVSPQKGTPISKAPSSKTDKRMDKLGTQKLSKPQKTAAKAGQKEKPVKESLSEERRNKGLFKGIGESIKKGFERGDGRRTDRGVTDKEDVKETGMLALLGPIAPALQELKGLAGERDEDEPSRISKMAGLFKKKKPDSVKESVKKEVTVRKKTKGLRDKKGKFLPKKAVPIPRLKAVSQKAKESPVTEKLDVIHDDLVTTEKDQEKRDKKLMKAVAAGGGAAGGGLLGGALDFLPGRKGRGVSAKAVPKGKGGLFRKMLPKTGIVGGTIASTGGAVTKLLGPLWKFTKLLGKIALPLTAAIAVFEGIMGWGDAAKISDKKEKDLTAGDKAQAAVSSILSGVALGTVESKTIYKEIDTVGEKTKAEVSGELSRLQFGLKNLLGFFKSKDEPKAKEEPKLKRLGATTHAASVKKESGMRLYNPMEAKSVKKANIPISEDRSPKVARKDKENQKKLDASNKDLIAESKKTNELLKKLVEKGNATPASNDYIPNGITNQSDRLSIAGLDEFEY